MDLELKGKFALVTGGTRGIGKAIAHRLAAEGANVAIVGRDAAALDVTAAEIAVATGANVVPIVADTGVEEQVKFAVAQVADRLGGIDIVVNCAAPAATTGSPPKLEQIDESALWPEVNVKVLGYIRVIREAAPHMRKRGGGRVINISGLAARASGSTVGTIRNIAVSALTKTLADELAADGIAVVCVHPGQTETERTPERLEIAAATQGITAEEARARITAPILLGRMVRAGEIANVVVFLASPKALPINGESIAIGGGQRGPIFY